MKGVLDRLAGADPPLRVDPAGSAGPGAGAARVSCGVRGWRRSRTWPTRTSVRMWGCGGGRIGRPPPWSPGTTAPGRSWCPGLLAEGGGRRCGQAVRRRNSTPRRPPGDAGSRRTRRAPASGLLPTGWPSSSAAQRLDDRGDRLVLGEAVQPARHGVDRHEGAARVGQEHHEEGETAGRLRRVRRAGRSGRQPGDREDEQQQDARRRPASPAARRPAGTRSGRRRRTRGRWRPALRTTLAATWPARTAAPPTSSERNRSMMPPVMSLVTLTAVFAEPNPAHSNITPGHDIGDVVGAGVDRAAEEVDEQQHQHDRAASAR